MQWYIVFPDLAQRKGLPRGCQKLEAGAWYPGVDLPPGPYWHPKEYPEHMRGRNIPILPGERIELFAVLTDDRSRTYRHIPLRDIRDRVRLLRRVRLTQDYIYEELYHTSLYTQWMQTGMLRAYDIRTFLPIERQNRRSRRSG
jgi:hypothetical protein